MRWGAPLAAAAGVLTFVGFGIAQLTGATQRADTSAAGSAADAPALAPEQPAPEAQAGAPGRLAAPPAAEQLLTTGRDYQQATLGGPAKTRDDRAPQVLSGSSAKPATADGLVPTLPRLRDSSALVACLDAIAQANAGGTMTVETVEYARYLGAPALVVRFSAANGRWAWAVGPDCGAPNAGAADLARAQVR